MVEITRYSQDMDGSMEPDVEGRWVRYEDIIHLLPLVGFADEWTSSDETTDDWSSSTEWEEGYD